MFSIGSDRSGHIQHAVDRLCVWLWRLFLSTSFFVQPVDARQDQGYRLTDRGITVNAPSHWLYWTIPTHAVDVTREGVTPHFFRDRYNILDDLPTFKRTLPELRRGSNQTVILNLDSTETRDILGRVITAKRKGLQVPLYTYFIQPGISRVGSNPRAAAHILDGDPTTYWEPDPHDPVATWWIEVDLGRVVPVDEIVLYFVEEGWGDPFRQFRLLAAPDQLPIRGDDEQIDFEVVGRTRAPNRDQRLFRFPLAQRNADPTWKGKMVETLRLVVTETKAGKGHRISEEAYRALSPTERGDVVYFVKDVRNFEEPVDRSVYEGLPSERQGRIEYYLRERPRLADIEVWGFGDNISLGLVEGGGNVHLSGQGVGLPGKAFDGDFSTVFRYPSSLEADERELVYADSDFGVLIVDLGATFWLHGMRISAEPPWGVEPYIVWGSEGTRDLNGQLHFRRISPRERALRRDNPYTLVDSSYHHVMDVYRPPHPLRFLKIIGGGHIREYQLFSHGYPAEVVLTSNLIRLPGPSNFGRLFWEGQTPPGTNLQIRTRSGNVLGKTIRYFDKLGNEVTPDSWRNLIGSYRGPTDTTFVPTSGWSPWSAPYPQPGDRVTSPGLRKYLQIQVELTTTGPEAAAAIHSIDIELTRPVADRILAELGPAQVAEAGAIDTFEVFIQPHFIEYPANSRSTGFDEILLSMSTSQSMELLELNLEVDPETGQANQSFRPSGTGDLFIDERGESLQLLSRSTGSDSIWIRLPVRLNILPDAPRTYNRITVAGEQVPVSQDGLPLSAAYYGRLDDPEKGDIFYFDKWGNPVDRATYLALEEEEQGPIRYFRILTEDEAQFPFANNGDTLDLRAYNQLPSPAQGPVVGSGALMRLRFQARVFRTGTTLQMAVRNTARGADIQAPWQTIEAGNATGLIESNTLSIDVPMGTQTIDGFALFPNPFTPNGDGLNDEIEIRFTVFKITARRQVQVRIYALDGYPVWGTNQIVDTGRVNIRWSGRDRHGTKVPPGLYLCKVELDTDVKEAGATVLPRLISLVY